MPSEPMNRRSGLGPAPEPGRRRVSITPLRRHHAQAFDEIVDMRVERSRNGRPSASRSSRRVSNIRSSAENGASVRPCGFSWASSAGPKAPASIRAAREVASISSTRPRCARSMVTAALWRLVAPMLDAAAHARAAAERRERRSDAAGPIHDGRNLRLGARIGDDVGRAIVLAEHGAHVIGIGFAVSMGGAIVALARAERRERGRRRHARRRQGDLLETRDLDRLEARPAEFLAIAAEHEVALLWRHPFAFAAPAIGFQSGEAHGFTSLRLSARTHATCTASRPLPSTI